MRFKEYLSELHNIETGQAIVAHEPTSRASSSVLNPKVYSEINYRLLNELNEIILSPETGIQKIRKVMHRFGLDMPALYEADIEGDEVVFDLKQFGQPHGPTLYGDYDTGTEVIDKNPDAYLYIIYYLTDEGNYDFYAEVTDEEGLDDIMSDEEDEEEEK
jgi:hypothetical protein